MTDPEQIPFKQLIGALLDADTPLPPRYLYRLSDLEDPELSQLRKAWPDIPKWRRKALLEDTESPAVRSLWEYEETDLVDIFRNLMENDSDEQVRAAAAAGLGKYVYLGEIEELPAEKAQNLENHLLSIATGNEPVLLRRRALESLGYSSREEVPPLIEAAYKSGDREWLITALFAMGRSAHEGWEAIVMKELSSSFPAIRAEASRAAGELELKDAVPTLVEMLDDPDENVRTFSIWSLSQIGGEGVREALENLYEETEDEEEAEYIETALDNLAFTEDMQLYALFDFAGEENETDEDEDKDLEEELLDFDSMEDDEDLED
jgi:hypothetical protein